MLPKNLRLDPENIPIIARKGKKFSNEYFDIKAWFDDSLDSAKFAISISLKISKKAVERNRIKRKLRASIQEFLKQDQVKKGKYLIIVRSIKLIDLSNEYIVKTLLAVLKA